MVTTIFGLRECPFMTPDFRVGSCAQNEPPKIEHYRGNIVRDGMVGKTVENNGT